MSARTVAAFVVTVALLTGVLLGIAADRWLLLGHLGRHHPRPMFGPMAPGMMPPGGSRSGGPRDDSTGGWVTRRLDEQVRLTPGQRAQIDSIMARRMAQRRELEGPIRDRMRALFDSTRADVLAVLTPEQRQRLTDLRARGDRPPRPPDDRAPRP